MSYVADFCGQKIASRHIAVSAGLIALIGAQPFAETDALDGSDGELRVTHPGGLVVTHPRMRMTTVYGEDGHRVLFKPAQHRVQHIDDIAVVSLEVLPDGRGGVIVAEAFGLRVGVGDYVQFSDGSHGRISEAYPFEDEIDCYVRLRVWPDEPDQTDDDEDA